MRALSSPRKYYKSTIFYCENIMRTLRGGPTFDPPQFLFEKNDHMNQFIPRPTFDPVRTNESGSKLSFRTVYQSRDNELFENSFLIHFH